MCVFPYKLVTMVCNYMVWTYAGRSQREVKFEKSSKFANKLTRATRPEKGELCSPELDIYCTYLYIHVATSPVRINV